MAKTVTLDYPHLGKSLTVDIDDEGRIIQQHWSNEAMTQDPDTLIPNHNLAVGTSQTYTELSDEDRILNKYRDAVETVDRCEAVVDNATNKLKEAKAEVARLHKLAVVIDPSLKRTRPSRHPVEG